MIQKHEGSAQSTPEYPRNRAPESAYAATHPAPHHRRKHTPPTCASQLARGSIPPLHAPSATASPRKRTRRDIRQFDALATRVPSANTSPKTHAATHPAPRKAYTPCPSKKAAPPTYTSLHAAQYLRYTRPAPPHRRESAHAATFVNSMPLLHARRTFSAPARRDGRASEAPAIHSLPARTLRLYYSAFCVQMRDIILPRGALFHHFLNVYTKGRPAAAKDTPPGDRPRAFIRFCR